MNCQRQTVLIANLRGSARWLRTNLVVCLVFAGTLTASTTATARGADQGSSAPVAVTALRTSLLMQSTGMVGPATPTPGSMGNALILGSTVSGNPSVEQTEAEANGFNVTVVSDAQWDAMTAADFRSYRVLILGDPTCGSNTIGVGTEAYNSQAAWEPVVMHSGGNKVLIGTDPVYHGRYAIIQNGIAYAGAVAGATGIYLDLSCTYDSSGAGTPVPILDGLSTQGGGQFTVIGEGAINACSTAVNIVASTGPTVGLTDADLSNWNCSVHEAFDKYPPDYTPLAIAPSGSGFPIDYCSTDVETGLQACGSPYILISGAGVISGGARIPEQGGALPLGENSTTCSTARPVNCATGAFWHTFTDVKSAGGRGVSLNFTRTYSSTAAASDSPFGNGWTDSYNLSLSFDGAGNATVTEADGSQVTFAPNGHGGFVGPSRVLASFVVNGDGTYTYSHYKDGIMYVFSASHQLVSETDRNGNATSLSYSNGMLTTVSDSSGRTLTLAYNGSHVKSLTDVAGHVWSYDYDGSGNLTRTTDPLGRSWAFSYGSNHLLLSMTDPRGESITNTYDGSDRVVSQVDPAGRTTTLAYSGDPTSTAGSTTTITDPNGDVTLQKYQSLQMLSVTRGYGTPQAATTAYQYDPNTLGVSQVTDPNGNVTTNTYDAHGNPLTHTDPLGHTTIYTYNSLNEVLTTTDPAGVTTTNTYDNNGDLLSRSIPLSGGGNATRSYSYGSNTQAGDRLTSTDPNGNTTTYSYDTAGDLTSATDPLGHTTTYTYDMVGNKTSQTTPLDHTTTYTYDAAGQLTETTDPLGHTTRYTYDAGGNQVSVTDSNGHVTNSTYDADSEQTQVTRADGTTTKTTYDGNGNVLTQTDGSDHTTTYSYDPLNRVVTTTDPLGRTTTNSYDGDGNLVSQLDAAGKTTTYSYDADNQLTGINYSSDTTPNVTQAYDVDGRRTEMTDGSGTSSFSYDDLGRLIREANGHGTSTMYAYDPAGHVTTITYPSGQTVIRTYDADGRLSSIKDWLGHTVTYTYDADGNPAGQSLPGSVTVTTAYDGADRPDGIIDSQGSGQLASFSYGRDANGQVTSSNASGQEFGNDNYSYDNLNRLTTDNGTTYGYDNADNPTIYNGQPQTFDAGNELLTSQQVVPLPTNGSSGGSGPSIPSGGGSGPSIPSGSGSSVLGERMTAQPGHISLDRTVNSHHANRHGVFITKPLTTTQPNELVLAFISAQGPGAQSVRRVSGGHLHWTRVTQANVFGGVASVWQAHAPAVLHRARIQATLTKAGYGGLLDVRAFAPGASISAFANRSSEKGAAALQLHAATNDVILAVGHEAINSHRRSLLPGSRLIDQLRGNARSGISWVQSLTATADGSLTIGDSTPKSRLWTLAAVAIHPPTTTASVTTDTTTATAPAPTTYPSVGPTATSTTQTFTYGYNQNGDRVSETSPSGTVTLSYDQANRLLSFTPNAHYSYDGDSLRASKTVDGTTTQFTWDKSGSVPLLLQSGDTSYIYGLNGASVEQITNNSATYFLSDQQESTRLLTDATGSVVGTYRYDAWGNITSHTGTATTDLLYDGQYTDGETGLQYLRARYYEPATGQFVTSDPAKAVTLAPYLYAGDTPPNAVDPLGLDWWNPFSWSSSTWHAIGTGAAIVGVGAGLVGLCVVTACVGDAAIGAVGGAAALTTVTEATFTTTTAVGFVADAGSTYQDCRYGWTTACGFDTGGDLLDVATFGYGRFASRGLQGADRLYTDSLTTGIGSDLSLLYGTSSDALQNRC